MKSKEQDTKLNDRDVRAFLEHGCEFEGKLQFSGVVRLNGKYRGDIESNDTLIVGDTAVIEGNIKVGAIVIGGKINGEIYAKHRAEILSTGFVFGEMITSALITHEGAQLSGKFTVRPSS